MLTGAGRIITWDAENRPVSITAGNVTATFVYDGDGNRALKVEGGQTVLYINRYLRGFVKNPETDLTAFRHPNILL